MIRTHKCIWPVLLGLVILSATAIPNIAMAQKTNKKQKKQADKVAEKLATAREISSASGKPILAVVSNLDTT